VSRNRPAADGAGRYHIFEELKKVHDRLNYQRGVLPVVVQKNIFYF
jgi:hypothetical protein